MLIQGQQQYMLLAVVRIEGDEVLAPSITYVATFQAISATGAKPICCDINNDNFHISLHKEKLQKTKAIIPVTHCRLFRKPAKILKLAKNLRVIGDASYAFGSKYKNSGSFGDITCFSFDGIKNITTGREVV